MRAIRPGTFVAVQTHGGLLPVDQLERIVARDSGLVGLAPEDYHLSPGDRINEVISRTWASLQGAWSAFREALAGLPPGEPGTTITRERWLLPLFKALDYGRLVAAKPVAIGERTYAISHAWQHIPIHLVGCGIDLDRRTRGSSATPPPHALLQALLNQSGERSWGFVSNGLRLRILRENKSLTRQSYLEFDLEAMMAGQAYADFSLLWLLCHQSRVESEPPGPCWLERWMLAAEEQGVRMLEQLRGGVERALSVLGAGLVEHPGNGELRRKLRTGDISPRDFYRQLLRLTYRLLFLFVAEDRGLLLDQRADAVAHLRYRRYYSTARLRRIAARRAGTEHHDLFAGLQVAMRLLSAGGSPELGLPAWGGSLWLPGAVPDFEGAARISNRRLLDAVRNLAFSRDREARRAIDYKNLDFEEIGSVYEALLELDAAVGDDGTTFDLRAAKGGERKQTGSFYTPHRLVNFLLDGTVTPLLAGIRIHEPGAESRLLTLRVCDPACGSGHFLIAAGRRLAMTLARIRTGDEEPSPAAVRAAYRDVAARCLFGVDINPLAVDLCKFALWIESLEPGQPLPDIETHIEVGDSLLAGWLDEQGGFDVVLMNPPFGAKIEAGYRKALGSRFDMAAGKFDSCAVFVERGLRLLKKGGLLGIVLPHAISRSGGYAALRAAIEAQCLCQVADAGSAFHGVSLEVVCVCIAKRPASGASYELVDMRGPIAKKLGVQDGAFLTGRPTIPLYVPRGVATGIVQKMEAAGTPLAKLASIGRGAGISARDPAIGNHRGLPVVRGRDIQRYGKLGPTGLLALLRGGGAKGLAKPTLCIQNIASRITGTIVPDGFLPLDTVNVIDFIESDLDIYSMLAILNSRLANWYLANVLINHAALTVHLDAPTIGHLPVVVPEKSAAMELARLARRSIETPQDAARSSSLSSEIDAIVEQIYGITGPQIGAIGQVSPRH